MTRVLLNILKSSFLNIFLQCWIPKNLNEKTKEKLKKFVIKNKI